MNSQIEMHLNETEIIEHSKLYPDQVFFADNGKIVFRGILFENQKELDQFNDFIKRTKNPVFLFFVNTVTFPFKVIDKVKKLFKK